MSSKQLKTSLGAANFCRNSLVDRVRLNSRVRSTNRRCRTWLCSLPSARVEGIAQHQSMRGRRGAVVCREHVLGEEIVREAPAGAEIGEAGRVLAGGGIHREEGIFDARA